MAFGQRNGIEPKVCFVLGLIILAGLCLLPNKNLLAAGKCLSMSEAEDRLMAIHGDPLLTHEAKVENLLLLKKTYAACSSAADSVYAKIVHRIGDYYNKLNNPALAISYTREAVLINTTAAPANLADNYLNLGIYSISLNQFDAYQAYSDSCILYATVYPHKYFIAFRALAQKAFRFFQNGDYQNSIDVADKGIHFASRIQNIYAAIPLYIQKAQSLAELNRLALSSAYINKAMVLLQQKQVDSSLLAQVYSVNAYLLGRKGDYKLSAKYYRSAFEVNKAIDNMQQCTRDLLDMGLMYDVWVNDKAKALDCYTRALRYAIAVNDVFQQVAIYTNMGYVYWRRQAFTEALRYFQKALNRLPINFAATSVFENPSLSQLKLLTNEYFITALLANKADALLGYYKRSKSKQYLHAALQTYELADCAVDIMRWRQDGEQSKIFWRSKTRNMYQNAIEASYVAGNVKKAFFFMEKSRAVLLNDKLSELGANKYLPPAERIQEQQLRYTVTTFTEKLATQEEKTPAYNKLHRALLHAREQQQKFIDHLEKKYPVYYQYKYNSSVYSFDDAKKYLLANRQVLVQFFNADTVLYIVSISSKKETLVKVPLKQYNAWSQELLRLCANEAMLNSNYQRYSWLAYHLYNAVFAPLQLQPGRVIISPDQNFFPFEALLYQKSDPQSYLVKKYAFSYVYSMAMLMQHDNVGRSGSASFLGVAPGTFSAYLKQPALHGSDASLQKITPYFSSSSVLVQNDATKSQFLAAVSKYNVVQIYSHADANDLSQQPVLYLNDSVLRLNELQSLEGCQAQMVVLSGCKTGLGANERGEGVFSLARGFLAAGVPCTITTLWQIDNKATYQLTELFYKYLGMGETKDVAMQHARLEYLQTNDKTKHLPYYWASAIVLGNTEEITTEKGIPTLVMTFAILIVLIVAAVLLSRRNYIS